MTLLTERREPPSLSSQGNRSALLVTAAGMASLVVGMSISRFAYTPILPMMLQGDAIDHSQGALLASTNLLGYLVGAVSAGAPALRPHPVTVLQASLFVNVLTLAMMVVPDSHGLWFVARFLNGISSAFIFVFASTLVLGLRRPACTTALFSSVGIGIVISGLLLPLCYRFWPAWETGWAVSTVLAATFASFAAIGARSSAPPFVAGENRSGETRQGASAAFWIISVSYGLAGFSYVVPATFLVTIMSSDSHLRAFAQWSWPIVGLFAAVSVVFWTSMGIRYGKSRTLAISLLVLALGCIAPVALHNAAGAIGGATGLGASFMAIAMLSVGLIRELDPLRAGTRIAGATAFFSIGQFLGPLFTAYSYSRTQGYAQALLVAATVLAVAAGIVAAGLQRR